MTATNVKREVLSSSLWNMGASGAQQVFSFLVFVVLARTLGPTDFGVMAIAAVFIDVLNQTARVGLTEVIIQSRSPTQEAASTAFWTAFACGAAQSLGLFWGASYICQLFDTRR